MINRGYDVWISDGNGQPLPEFNMERVGNDGKTMACYLPSESGKRFIINWRDHNGLHHTSFKCTVDGKPTGSKTCKPNSVGKRIGVRMTKDSCSTYQFADLRTTDDEDALLGLDIASLEKVGTIEVRAVRIRAETRPVPFKAQPFAGVGAVHERSKKLGGHCVTLGAPVKRQPTEQCKSVLLDRREGPYATFIFRYRPPGLLQAQGIMPAPDSALALQAESNNIKGKARTAAGDIDLAPSSSNKKPPVKAKTELRPTPSVEDVIELTDDDDDDMERKPVLRRPQVKREPGPRRTKVKADPDDVIDLTLD
ncbi:hypothetical protein BV20DRAFT_1018689 [Pilatotrama ljubarskyi]|nr:hypothetical protein BV20DRAFT_1018689 [Pilatotrama ljubarskyi]